MQHKFLLILPISVIGLLSCMPDSTPKSLSYEETLSYINKNFKEVPNPSSGWVEYSTDYETNPEVQRPLTELGVTSFTKSGKNEINSSKISDYITYSNNEGYLTDVALSLMYLSPNNFPKFIDKKLDYTFSYQLTYVKELIMTSTSNDNNFSYVRYYNASLHLTRFEVNCTKSDESYTATQTFIY